MDLKKLQFWFKTGGLLALTPPTITSFKPTIPQRCYIVLVFCFYTVAVLWGNIQKTKFSTKYNYIQILLNLMVDLNLYVHTCYSLVLLLTTKRRQWFKLVNNLSRIDRFATDNTSNLAFVIALVIFLVATILNASWLYNFGWNFLRIYIVEYFQVFLNSLVNGEEQWSEHSVGIRLVLYLSKHSAISTYCVRPGIFQDLSLNLSILDHNFLDNFALRHRFERIQTLGKFISAT
jgi:hypothetical protein